MVIHITQDCPLEIKLKENKLNLNIYTRGQSTVNCNKKALNRFLLLLNLDRTIEIDNIQTFKPIIKIYLMS